VIQIINNNSVGGPRKHDLSTSVSTNTTDLGFDSVNCLRQLWTGTGANATRVKTGINEVLRTANLGGRPAIVVHGRNDVLIPVNFSSRPYVLRNQQVEGAASQLRYIEVTNAQHFDSFLPGNVVPGYDTRFVPLHLYYVRAMDAMWAHLKSGSALPPSQVVHTVARGGTAGAAPALTATNVPPIAANPALTDRIAVTATTLTIPD